MAQRKSRSIKPSKSARSRKTNAQKAIDEMNTMIANGANEEQSQLPMVIPPPPLTLRQKILNKIDEETQALNDALPPALRAVNAGLNELGPKGVPSDDPVHALFKTPTLIEAYRETKKKYPALPTRRIYVKKDHILDYPDIYFEVYIQGPKWEEAMFAEMLVRASCTRAKSLDKADLVIFTGGDDVNPVLYGERAHVSTQYSDPRDTADMLVFQECVEKGVPMLGVCRGAQFLHVMNGGKLFQHIDNHNQEHPIWDSVTDTLIDKASSVHHQAVRPNPGMQVLATARKSTTRWLNDKDKDDGMRADIEAFFYRDTCCLGIQGHPEYSGYPYFTKWSLELIQKYINENPDVKMANGNVRVKEELRAFFDPALAHGILNPVLLKETK